MENTDDISATFTSEYNKDTCLIPGVSFSRLRGQECTMSSYFIVPDVLPLPHARPLLLI